MSSASEVLQFLTSRSAKITPQQRAGQPIYGRQRRVSGLGREKVALLAGINVEHYTRLEARRRVWRPWQICWSRSCASILIKRCH